MKKLNYERQKVYDYAKEWAFKRNPKYYNFDSVGGDCTNFASQCIYAGSKMMNYQSANSWYYTNGNQKSPSWTGVEFLYQFLIQNQAVGPYGREVTFDQVDIGDIAQLSFDGKTFAHTLVVVDRKDSLNYFQIKIASHTKDSFGKRIRVLWI